MQIGQVIRKYRKQKDMTQEEMAKRLGVTAPAVNKWENGNSYPDIALLAPIARLLDISTDTLLSFHEELTAEEIQEIIYTVDSMLREKSFEETFAWAQEKIRQYPNCEPLILEIAVLLNAAHMRTGDEAEDAAEPCAGRPEQHEQHEQSCNGQPEQHGSSCDRQNDQYYEQCIVQWFTDALRSEQEQIRTMAADSLFYFYLNRKQYDEAEKCLEYFSQQNPERKRKQALIYSRTERRDEAYKTYEELLLSIYQMANLLFQSVSVLSMQDRNMDKVHAMAEKQNALAVIFEMGRYHQVSGGLEPAIMERDVEKTLAIVKTMLESFDEINGFTSAPLYEHMTFRESRAEFMEQVREDLLRGFRNDPAYDFLKEDARWQELVQ